VIAGRAGAWGVTGDDVAVTTVGFAGLGRMGAPMAANLAGAGLPLAVWNRSTDRCERLAHETGALVCTTPRELAERCDVVVAMLADDRASEQVHLADDGLFASTGGAVHMIEMGTLSPGHVHMLAERAGDRVVVDAPVSGSVDAARDAQLLVMVGADLATIEPVRPVLDAMARTVLCLGSLGRGATMKLAINMLIHGLNQTLAESLTLAEAAGIEPERAYRAIEESAAAAPMIRYRKQLYLDEPAHPVSFALALARKDVALAMELASEFGVSMPQTQLNLDQLRAAEAAGFGERDMASMVDYVRRLASTDDVNATTSRQ
jgi:3-hydroxyisobutyrate dehydrogenase-like beta-hydroxyacid dehydrogenase